MNEKLKGIDYRLDQIADDMIETEPCVYFIYFRIDLRYIGKTKNPIHIRIRSHIQDRSSKVGAEIRDSIGLYSDTTWFGLPRWNMRYPEMMADWRITVYPMPGVANLGDTELWCIRKFMPPLNVQGKPRLTLDNRIPQ